MKNGTDLLGSIVTNPEIDIPCREELKGKVFIAASEQEATTRFNGRKRKSYLGLRSNHRQERLHDHRRPLVLPMRRITVILALAFSLTLLLANSPVAARDYAAFAKVSNKEQALDPKACGKYGGRRISNRQYDLVMTSGRTDDTLYNVIYHGGYQYVTFKIDASNSISRLFGFQNYKVGLCQF